VTAPPPPPCWPRRWCAKACATWPPAPTRWASSAASRPSPPRSPSIAEQAKEIDDQGRDRPGRRHLGQPTPIGEVLADAIDKVGKDGVVTVEESNTFGMELDFTEGMQFDKGYLSPYFVTDPERQGSRARGPYILFTNGKISSVQDMVPCSRRSCRAASRC
jgi:hypothetical protein